MYLLLAIFWYGFIFLWLFLVISSIIECILEHKRMKIDDKIENYLDNKNKKKYNPGKLGLY